MHTNPHVPLLNGTNSARANSVPNRHADVVILGGGVSGLTCGLELARRGYKVTVLERAPEVGGLARTVQHGAFRFDVGGHRFHSHNPQLLDWLHALLGADLLSVKRRSHIYLQGKYVRYPLQFPGALGIFGPRQLLAVMSSYVAARWRQRHAMDEATTFEAWVVQRFGQRLFDVYFRPYTEKVWGIPCRELSADWAAQRISLPNLTTTVRRALLPGRRPPPTAVTEFFYPRLGFGMIPQRIASALQRAGGRIMTSTTVEALWPAEQGCQVHVRTREGGIQWHAAQVISTIPIDSLLQLLPPDSQAPAGLGLAYRDLICIFLAVDRPQISGDHWTYFPQQEILFGRIHEPRNWSSAMAPENNTSLVAEIFTGRNESTWMMSDQDLVKTTIEQLEALGILDGGHLVSDTRVLRVKNAYPVYRLGYATQLQRAHNYLQQFPRLHLAGRTGAFHYMNSDGVIEDALGLVEWLSGQVTKRRDVNTHYAVH